MSSWLSGFPIRTSFASGIPVYDPEDNKPNSIIERQALDCLVWVDAFGRSIPPNLPAEIPLIYIGHPTQAKKIKADVTIPVGTPGIHHKAKLVRTDSVVTVPLDRITPSKLPTVKAVADRLASSLSDLREAGR